MKALLNGAIKPNDPIVVESDTLEPRRGVYKVVSVQHRGNIASREFYSIVDCVRASSGIVELAPDTAQATQIATT